jgi:hypothetical protein
LDLEVVSSRKVGKPTRSRELTLEEFPADQKTRDREEGLVDGGAPFAALSALLPLRDTSIQPITLGGSSTGTVIIIF